MKLFFSVVLFVAASGAKAGSTIQRSVLSGGAVGATATTHRTQSTLGQSLAGTRSAVLHRIDAGFWAKERGTNAVGAEMIPGRFRFLAPAPNPFREAAILRYDVPARGGRVRLKIYDVRGRLVRVLIDNEETPGFKSVTWDGCDSEGDLVSFGFYICSFEAPGYHRTQKLVRID